MNCAFGRNPTTININYVILNNFRQLLCLIYILHALNDVSDTYILLIDIPMPCNSNQNLTFLQSDRCTAIHIVELNGSCTLDTWKMCSLHGKYGMNIATTISLLRSHPFIA